MIDLETSIRLINHLHLLKSKVDRLDADNTLSRQWRRMDELLQSAGFLVESPVGLAYDPARTDLEVSMTGEGGSGWTITEVIKPVIYRQGRHGAELLQKGVAIAASQAGS